jgi:sugar lactone lactonase YvrE
LLDNPRNPDYAGRPDGAAVDVAGNYYVAMYEGARVLKLSPDGVVLASIAVPAQCPTMPCLGGEDARTLFVTTARQNRPAAELQKYPDSGCIFERQVDVPGLPVNFYAA